MPTYPLTFPSSPNIETFSPRPVRAVGVTTSPFDLSSQVSDHRGALWVGEVKMPPMKRASAYDWEVFILECRGMSGTFLMGPPLAGPTGTGTTGDLSTAGAAYDESLAVQNAGAGVTFKRGNWIQVGTNLSARLHKITADATADGSGNVTINIEPALKQAYGATTAVTVSSPVGVWRLGSNDVGWSIGKVATFGFAFPVTEAL